MRLEALAWLLLLAVRLAAGEDAAWRRDVAGLPPAPPPPRADWLVEPVPSAAGVYRGAVDHELVLDNGLVRRTFRLAPDAACVGLDGLQDGRAWLRATRPEARVTLDGREWPVGGLSGQPLQNFLEAAWLDALTADPQAFRFSGWRAGPIEERFAWTPRREWISRPAVAWPPPGAHLDHDERRLHNLLGAGVQACWRGPRLYDTARTLALVRHRVDWFRQHRRILESDVVPLRRPDGRDWDGLLHVDPDPAARERALAALYNPLEAPLARTLSLPLRWAGLSGAAQVTWPDGSVRLVALDGAGVARVEVELPPRGFQWLVVEAAP